MKDSRSDCDTTMSGPLFIIIIIIIITRVLSGYIEAFL
jgi:hypothetical protein